MENIKFSLSAFNFVRPTFFSLPCKRSVSTRARGLTFAVALGVSLFNLAVPLEAALLAALNTCLGQLGVRSSELILRYYAGQGAAGQHARLGLAQEWNISINALRNKALRIRQALEQCVRRRLQGLGDA